MLARTSRTRRNVALIYANEPPVNERRAICRLPRRCRMGFHSGTLTLMSSMHSIALVSSRLTYFFVGSVRERRWRIESNEDKSSTLRFDLRRSGGGQTMAGVQSATPNPSIEGMPKKLRFLCTPHVKR